MNICIAKVFDPSLWLIFPLYYIFFLPLKFQSSKKIYLHPINSSSIFALWFDKNFGPLYSLSKASPLPGGGHYVKFQSQLARFFFMLGKKIGYSEYNSWKVVSLFDVFIIVFVHVNAVNSILFFII